MITVILTADPSCISPKGRKQPRYLKEAYVGLKFSIDGTLHERLEQIAPPNCYLVPMRAVIRAMETHNVRAYEYMKRRWGTALLEEDEDTTIQIFYVPHACSDIITVLH